MMVWHRGEVVHNVLATTNAIFLQDPCQMSTEAETLSPPQFLETVLGKLSADVKPGTAPIPELVSQDPTLPYVTLTFAQSLDAKIAGRAGIQLTLSGPESMEMTHWCTFSLVRSRGGRSCVLRKSGCGQCTTASSSALAQPSTTTLS
jgi:hypothetical protein